MRIPPKVHAILLLAVGASLQTLVFSAPAHARDPRVQKVKRGTIIVKVKAGGATVHAISANAARIREARALRLLLKNDADFVHARAQRVFPRVRRRSGAVSLTASRMAFAAAAAPEPAFERVYKLVTRSPRHPEQLCRKLLTSGLLQYCQPDYIVYASTLPNDPAVAPNGSPAWSRGFWGQSFPNLWGLQMVRGVEAWNSCTTCQGDGVVVAVVDTGLDFTHPDNGAIYRNTGEIAGNRIDDDRNGLIDDWAGWDFNGNDNSPSDGSGHGTHVAGTIAAAANNGIGIAGVAPRARILPLKGLGDDGSGETSSLAAAIRYAADILDRNRDGRVDQPLVINNSWGCSNCPSNPVVEEAVRHAVSRGAVVVFAAGNANVDVRQVSPQNMSEVIAVAAIDHEGRRASFSNYGAYVDVAAPGGGDTSPQNAARPSASILSLLAANSNFARSMGDLVIGGQYIRLAGTSMAAPHVAGAAALVLSAHPEFTPAQVETVLKMTAARTPISDQPIGTGIIDAAAAVAVSAPPFLRAVITSPNADVAGAGPSGFSVTGTVAGSNCSLAYSKDGPYSSQWTTVSDSVCPASGAFSATIDTSLLQNNTFYTLKLTARAQGYSISSVKRVFIDRDLITSWPVQTRYLIAGMTAADIDQDGSDELLVTGALGGTTNHEAALLVLDQAGRNKPGWPFVSPSPAISVPVVADLDADGTREIAAITANRLFIWRADGTQLAARDVDTTSSAWGELKLIAVDLDLNGDLELVGVFTPVFTPARVFAFHHDGTPVSGWQRISVETTAAFSRPAVADINADGLPELMIANYTPSDLIIRTFSHSGVLLAQRSYPIAEEPGNNYVDLQIVNLDADPAGTLEVVVAAGRFVSVMDVNGNLRPGWPQSLGPLGRRTPNNRLSLVDLDGDGDLEILQGFQLATMMPEADRSVLSLQAGAWHHNGAAVSGWPISYAPPASDACSPFGIAPLAADMDGDGALEVLIASTCGSALGAAKANGARLSGWPKGLPSISLFATTPVVADLNGDGLNEIYGATESAIYGWNTSGLAQIEGSWTNYFGGNEHTGARPVRFNQPLQSRRNSLVTVSAASGCPGGASGFQAMNALSGSTFAALRQQPVFLGQEQEEMPSRFSSLTFPLAARSFAEINLACPFAPHRFESRPLPFNVGTPQSRSFGATMRAETSSGLVIASANTGTCRGAGTIYPYQFLRGYVSSGGTTTAVAAEEIWGSAVTVNIAFPVAAGQPWRVERFCADAAAVLQFIPFNGSFGALQQKQFGTENEASSAGLVFSYAYTGSCLDATRTWPQQHVNAYRSKIRNQLSHRARLVAAEHMYGNLRAGQLLFPVEAGEWWSVHTYCPASSNGSAGSTGAVFFVPMTP